MKTLIFNGSPRRNGDTAAMIKILTDNLRHEYKIVDCYYDDISPCLDCRYCVKRRGCSVNDGMQEVYADIEDCSGVVIASPIFFGEVTGRVLDVCSRFQRYYCDRFFRKVDKGISPKIGGIMLAGGGDGSCEKAFSTARTLLHQINVREIFDLVCSHNTNAVSPAEDKACVQKIVQLAEFLNLGDTH